MTKGPTVRLDKLLANLGYGSRREIEQMARAGDITLEGAALTDAAQRVTTPRDLPDHMQVRGKPIDPPQGMVLMLHKPLGVTCSHKEAGELVYDLLPLRWRRRDPALSTVGRLDKETSGLLLLTDDGPLLHRIISPRRHVAKRYRATLARPFNGDEALIFAAGTLLLEGDDKPLAPAEFEPISANEAYLVLHEGRYHQVRRMFAAIGNHVDALHRDKVGGLILPDDLPAGQWRILDEAAVAAIFA